MKKIVSTLLVCVLFFSYFPIIEANSGERQQVIVLFQNKVDKNLIKNAQGEINREYENISALSVSIPKAAIKGLERNPNVIAIEHDQKVEIESQVQDWGIQRVQAPRAWESNLTGKDVKVAVLDTGIASHPDLVISGGVAFVEGSTSFHDVNGHGTHVAGIIAARNNSFGTVGIAPEVSLFAVKVLGDNGEGNLSDVIAGIDWSINQQMDIINLSLGAESHSLALKQIVDKAFNAGILVVGAAGNNGNEFGTGDTVTFPSRYDSVIAVSAVDSRNRRGSFSATGNTIEVAAPGVNVLSTHLNNGYAYMNGTSMAAPYVAGNLALLKQKNPNLSAQQLRAMLQANVIDLGEPGRDPWFGYGLIQAPELNAVELKLEHLEIPNVVLPTNHGQIVGRIFIRHSVPLFKKQEDDSFVFFKQLLRGNTYNVFGTYLNMYHVGGGYYVEATERVSVHIGRILIRGEVDLYRPDGTVHRKLNPGEAIRVFSYDDNNFYVGADYYVKRSRDTRYYLGFLRILNDVTMFTPDGQPFRTLKKGEQVRVFDVDQGVFDVGGGFTVRISRANVNYIKH